MDVMKPAKTQARLEREAREEMIVNDFNARLSVPGAMKEPVTDLIAKEYEIGRSTLWAMRKRVEKRKQTEV